MIDLVDFVDLIDLVDLVDLIDSMHSADLVYLADFTSPALPNLALPAYPNAAFGFPRSSARGAMAY